MSEKADRPSNAGGVQVFELTMNNSENQDELNRRLRRPGEPDPDACPKNGHAASGEATQKEEGEQKPGHHSMPPM